MDTLKNAVQLNPTTKIEGIIPVIGFGTWEILGNNCIDSVADALDIGYRHVDTAQMYGNEKEVGEGIKKSHVSREDIFVTTKIATHNMEPSLVRSSTIESLKKLGTGHVDLLLIHWPTPGMDLKACLETMMELKEDGKISNLGVSNFSPSLYRLAIEIGGAVNNQVKFSPFEEQFDNLEVARAHKLSLTAYSPLERGRISSNDALSKIGKKYRKTASQVALRWLLQLGNVSIIPKAASKQHREENFKLFDFELSEEEMKEIKGLG
jgi:2,5-diketo-D-gluconate reductase B